MSQSRLTDRQYYFAETGFIVLTASLVLFIVVSLALAALDPPTAKATSGLISLLAALFFAFIFRIPPDVIDGPPAELRRINHVRRGLVLVFSGGALAAVISYSGSSSDSWATLAGMFVVLWATSALALGGTLPKIIEKAAVLAERFDGPHSDERTTTETANTNATNTTDDDR